MYGYILSTYGLWDERLYIQLLRAIIFSAAATSCMYRPAISVAIQAIRMLKELNCDIFLFILLASSCCLDKFCSPCAELLSSIFVV